MSQINTTSRAALQESLIAVESGAVDQFTQSIPDEGQATLDAIVDAISNPTKTAGRVFDKNARRSIMNLIEDVDRRIGGQLGEILHDPKMQKIEGTWRGLHHLIRNTETGTNLQVRMMAATKADLEKDLTSATDFDGSALFKKVYEEELGTPGGVPYAALIGDYEFSHNANDMDILEKITAVSAMSHCPFITAPSPELFKLDSFEQLARDPDLAMTFAGKEFIRWRSFRESDNSRYCVMAMPRVLARLPYGKSGRTIQEFNFEELPLDAYGEVVRTDHADYTWMNASYVLGTQLTSAFAETGWVTRSRGFANGGKVEGLPTHIFLDDEGDLQQKCPTEIAVTGRRENELSKLGFLPLCHYKNTDYAVFFGGQTVQKPKNKEEFYGADALQASQNSHLCAGLQYIMAASRIAHCLKIKARDMIGSAMEREDVESDLNTWLTQYVLAKDNATAEQKARKPLAEARVEVVSGDVPGSYNSIAHIRPWLQVEQLTASIRLVASVPKVRS